MNSTNNMTEGSPLKTILRFSVPMLIGNLFQQFYNVADTLIVGQTLGSRALAAVGATGSTIFFILALVLGFTSAISIVMSQYFGANNKEMLRSTLVSSIYLTAASIIFISLLGVIAARPIMLLLKTPADIIDGAVTYTRICFGGCAGLLVYNSVTAVLRAVGDSKTPLYFLMLSSVLNILLDLVFILVFGMGIAGAAAATILSQTISAVLCVVYMFKKFPIFRLTREDMRPDMKNIGLIVRMGLPTSFQAVLLSAGEMTITGVVNTFGTDVVAAYAASKRIEQFATLAFLTISQAFSVYAGQNLGAMKLERITDGFKKMALIIIALTPISAFIIFTWGDIITGWFISDNDAHIKAIVEIARLNLRIEACFFPFLGLIWLYNNTLRGMGEVTVPLISGITELVFKVGLSLLLSYLIGYVGIWYANPIGWAIGIVPSAFVYHSGRWRKLAGKITKAKAL